MGRYTEPCLVVYLIKKENNKIKQKKRNYTKLQNKKKIDGITFALLITLYYTNLIEFLNAILFNTYLFYSLLCTYIPGTFCHDSIDKNPVLPTC